MKRVRVPHLQKHHWELFRRVALIAVLGTASTMALLWSPELETWRAQWRTRWIPQLQRPAVENLRQFASILTSVPETLQQERTTLSDELLLSAAQEIRTENNLPLFQENATLKRLSRLLALEAEDAQSIEVPAETRDIMRRLTPSPPKNVEVIILFAPKNAPELDLRTQLASSSAVMNRSITEIGISTRSATLDEVPGVLGVVTVASTFPSEPPIQTQETQSPVRPTFTGQDLWQAVQNYRKAHSLPAFEQSNELCTVASIRVNELLALGKLDNHDGFQKRADEFFERNKGWTAINENIASGYQTAVQTVEWGWDQSLGHQALIQSREYPKACAAANSGFSVLVTGK